MIKNQKLYDCIPFYQSNLLFELRLHTLSNIVDKFIVCEATKSHSGETKELIFDLKRFHKFKNKIEYIVVDDMPDKKSKIFDKYPLYNFQIDKLLNGIKEAEDEDFIMMSDEDEIPNPNVIENYSFKNFKYAIFLQNLYYYKFNIQNLDEFNGNEWPGSRICKKKSLKKFSTFRSLKTKNSKAPFWKFWKEKSIQLIKNGGWHFTYLMDSENIAKKIKSSEHNEFNTSAFTQTKKIKYRMNNLIDPFDRSNRLKKVNIDESFPEYLFKNQDYYSEWILK